MVISLSRALLRRVPESEGGIDEQCSNKNASTVLHDPAQLCWHPVHGPQRQDIQPSAHHTRHGWTQTWRICADTEKIYIQVSVQILGLSFLTRHPQSNQEQVIPHLYHYIFSVYNLRVIF